MSFDPPRERNPFEAPRAGIGPSAYAADFLESDSDAELIRREHIGREASVKSLGLLLYLFTFFGVLSTIFMVVLGSGLVPIPQNADPNAPPPETMRLLFLGLSLLYLVFTLLYAGVGYGLRRLQAWARWTTVVLMVLSLLYVLAVSGVVAIAQPIVGLASLMFGSLIPGYILYLMVSAKARVVFSPEYKVVIRKTPHVKYQTSLIVKIFLGLLLLAILAIVIAAIASQVPR